jgi:hypothetical protein
MILIPFLAIACPEHFGSAQHRFAEGNGDRGMVEKVFQRPVRAGGWEEEPFVSPVTDH